MSTLSVPDQHVVISTSHAGFVLSETAVQCIGRGAGMLIEQLPRDHPLLLEVVTSLGRRAGGMAAFGLSRSRLAVVTIPGDIAWTVIEDHGREWVAEVHRRWDEQGEIPQGVPAPRPRPEYQR